MTVESFLSPPGQFLASPLKLYYAIKKLPGRRYICTWRGCTAAYLMGQSYNFWNILLKGTACDPKHGPS
jgi:hypothetical protein